MSSESTEKSEEVHDGYPRLFCEIGLWTFPDAISDEAPDAKGVAEIVKQEWLPIIIV